jgi:uncharacterized membrane protein YfcA
MDVLLRELLELFGVGLLAGGLGALLGVGGGVILVPGLIFLADLSFTHAVAASLVCVVATSVAGSVVYLGRGMVELDLALELQAFTVVGAVAAGLLAAVIPVAPLYFAFGVLLAVTAYRMWPRRKEPRAGSASSGRRPAVADGASVGAGLVSGLLGVGGGVLNVPILHLLLAIPFERAVATSVYIIGITAASAAAVYWARGEVDLAVAGATMLGTLLGARLAATGSGRVPAGLLKRGFAILLVYTAIRMTLRGFGAM